MREIIKYIRLHLKEDFHLPLYLYTACFLAACITLNYVFNFEHSILDRTFGKEICMLHYSLFFAFAYYGVAIPQALWTGNKQRLRNRLFWTKSLLFIALIGISSGFYYYIPLTQKFSGVEAVYMRKILLNLRNIFIYLVPLIIIKQIFDKKISGVYGLNLKGFNPRPYIAMLLIVAPLVACASFRSDFLTTYPTMKPWNYAPIFGLTSWQMSGIYEFFYGFDFFFIELMFRGALVIGMATVIGKDAVLPMVAAYAFLHFGKPYGETISSVFGGYVLGVIALNTRKIFGGCVIHIGVAYCMEIAALIQYYRMGKL